MSYFFDQKIKVNYEASVSVLTVWEECSYKLMLLFNHFNVSSSATKQMCASPRYQDSPRPVILPHPSTFFEKTSLYLQTHPSQWTLKGRNAGWFVSLQWQQIGIVWHFSKILKHICFAKNRDAQRVTWQIPPLTRTSVVKKKKKLPWHMSSAHVWFLS